jgi:hypothetical protein
MTELSSAEQVRSAYVTAYANSRFPGHDVRFPMSPPERYGLVAALRAVADEVAPVDLYPNDGGWTQPRGEDVVIREKILAIAAELGALPE